jgi:chromosome segregation ATPase
MFAEKSRRARQSEALADEEPRPLAPPAGAAAGELPTEERLAQGFELLFGAQVGRQRLEIERIERELAARLDAAQAELARHAQRLEDLLDRSRATLERESDELRRRKGVEDELRQQLAELQARLGRTAAESGERAAALGEQIEALLAKQPEAEAERHRALFVQLEGALARLEASKVDRAELAALFAAALRRLAPDGSAGQ